MSVKLDILAFGAHPDDVELGCAGTLIKEIEAGKKVGIIDLTEGELGSRGSRELRKEEAQNAAQFMRVTIRENLNIGDGFFEVNEQTLLQVVKVIRTYQPDIVITNAKSDRHPDHARGHKLVERAAFLSGLLKIETEQEKWRPKLVLNYIQDRYIEPDIIIPINNYFDKKMEAVMCYSSQFYSENQDGPKTPISSQQFLDHLKGRAVQYGREIGEEYGEGFTCSRGLGVNSMGELL